MKDLFPLSRWNLKLATVALLGIFSLLPSGAQTRETLDRSSANRNQAIDPARSRAAQAADELVSLSAEKIIALLRGETGLLLQVKKVLVQKAYEQGRMLDSQDLTDEAIFRTIRESENIRVIVTREIEDRYYVRVKPRKEELERGQVLDSLRKPGEAVPTADRLTVSQEDVYWATHKYAQENYPEQPPVSTPASPSAPPTSPSPEPPDQDYSSPGQPLPSNPSVTDPRRQLERVDLQQGDYPDSFSGFNSSMGRGSSTDLQLMSAGASQRSMMGGAGLGLGSGMGMGSDSALSPFPMPGSSGFSSSGFDLSSLSRDQYPQTSQPELPQTRRSQIRIPPRRPQQPALRHRPNPYADVPSLFDLYSQYSDRPVNLQRFGAEIFRTGTGNMDLLPMDMPVGPEYVLGPGDGLSIQLWGGISQRLVRVVDRQGRVSLPEVGTVEVSGKSLGEVQRLVQSALRTQLRDVQADVSLSRLRSVRVYVVGDVERPGAYDVSSLSTPLNAVYMAGGPTVGGSLRVIRHYRGKQLLQETDVYDLLLHGVSSDLQGLQAGDTVMVPPLGSQVTIEGMVRRPAIYETHGEKSLSEILELAGGVMQTGTLRHVDVERVESHLSRSMLRLDIPEDNNQAAVTKALNDFQIQDGDKVKISPILPYADKTVYLEGHVFRPGKFAYREGMKVTDVIHSYNELLPEPYGRHAEIIRLNPPDYTPRVLAFNLVDALANGDQDIILKPFDTIRVFGRYDFEDAPIVTVTGEVRDPGDHITNGATYLRDAVFLAGGATSDAQLSDAQVFRRSEDGKLKVISVNLSQALAGDPKENLLLEPKDRVFVHKSQGRANPATVMIHGEVERPGKYPLGDNLTAVGLVKLAGGLKRSAYTEEADLTRYQVQEGTKIVGDHVMVPIAKALADEPDSDVRLHNGDVLTIRQLAGWNDIGATIAVKGEVVHPGTYGIQDGERLSSIIERAGGFRSDAYPYGAIFQRTQVRELEEKNHEQLMREIHGQEASLRQAPDTDDDQRRAKAAALQQWEATLKELENTPPSGRMVIHVSSNTKRWANTSADIQVRAGDSIYIPKKSNTVIVDGSVYNPTAITYKSGRNAGWYLRQAGGPNNMANKKGIFVIRADGSVVGGAGGLFSGGFERAELRPGDMVVVPEKAFSANTRWRSIMEGAQLAYAVGIAIQVARSF
jgi:protein involved in polysaccharide export with SLBB domain